MIYLNHRRGMIPKGRVSESEQDAVARNRKIEASGRRHRGMAGSTAPQGWMSVVYRVPQGKGERPGNCGTKNPKKISENPLTSGLPSAIIRAQGEERQSPRRVRPMRVRKTSSDEPTARRKLLMVRYTEWGALGSRNRLKCRGNTCGLLESRDSSSDSP